MINWYIKGKTWRRPILLVIIIVIKQSQAPVVRLSDFANPPWMNWTPLSAITTTNWKASSTDV